MKETVLMTMLSPDDLTILIRAAIRTEMEREQPKEQRPVDDDLLTQAEACKLLSKSRQTLTEWRRKGLINAHKIGNTVYFKKSQLLEQNR
jgi:excisionase family DNA binding protein